MRATYKQVAEKFSGEDESLNYDHSPTRESQTRIMSASSQRSTMNSMSRTIDPRYAARQQQQQQQQQPVKTMSLSRTVGSTSRKSVSLNASIDDRK